MFFNWVQRRSVRRRRSERRDGSPRAYQRSAGRPAAEPRAQEASTTLAVEKRHGERMRLDGHLKGEVMVFQPMTILDISSAGLQIQTAFPLQFDSQHAFRMALGYRSVIVTGHVAYCHISELTDTAAVYRSGIRFVELPPAATAAIADFVSAIRSARS